MFFNGENLAKVLYGSNILTFCFGAVISGLAIGTILRNELLEETIELRSPFYKSLYDVTGAGLANGLFICAAAILGCLTVKFRGSRLHLANIFLLMILFCLSLATGISTLIIASEKVPLLKITTLIKCILNGESASRGSPERFRRQYALKDEMNGFETVTKETEEILANWKNGMANEKDEIYESRFKREPRGFGMSGLDNTFPKGFPFGDCESYHDLITPIGALLVTVAFIYLLIIGLASKQFIGDKESTAVARKNNAQLDIGEQ